MYIAVWPLIAIRAKLDAQIARHSQNPFTPHQGVKDLAATDIVQQRLQIRQ